MTVLLVNPLDVHAPILTQLRTLPNVTTFDGLVGTLTKDAQGRVNPYTVLYGDPGNPSRARLSGRDLRYQFQVQCVASYQDQVMLLAHRVRALLTDWAPAVTAGTATPIAEIGANLGVRRDPPEVVPPRFYIPLYFCTTATAIAA